MTPEIWTVIGVGVAIAALILVGGRYNHRVISEFRSEIYDRIGRVNTQIGDLRDRLSRFEGSIDVVLNLLAGDRAT